jgi:hypothetical protein
VTKRLLFANEGDKRSAEQPKQQPTKLPHFLRGCDESADRLIEKSNRQSGVISREEATQQPTKRLLLSRKGDEVTDRAASPLGRMRQTNRQSSVFSLMKATNNSREKATKQPTTRLLLSSEGYKPTDRATDKATSLDRKQQSNQQVLFQLPHFPKSF